MNSLVTTRFKGLRSLPAEYASLFETASAHDVFLSLPWFQNFERNILGSDGADVFGVQAANDASSVLGALVMQRSPAAKIAAPRRLQGLANYYSSSFAPIVRDGSDERTIRALAEAVWMERGRWDVLELQPLDQSAPFFSALTSA